MSTSFKPYPFFPIGLERRKELKGEKWAEPMRQERAYTDGWRDAKAGMHGRDLNKDGSSVAIDAAYIQGYEEARMHTRRQREGRGS